jgi:hypothetical protein
VTVVVVGVAHGPAAQVALRLPLLAAVDEAHVAVGPLPKVVKVGWLLGRSKERTAVMSSHTSCFASSPSTSERYKKKQKTNYAIRKYHSFHLLLLTTQ